MCPAPARRKVSASLKDELMLEEVARVLHDLEASQDGIPLPATIKLGQAFLFAGMGWRACL